jgi:hypothetical protein
MLFSHLFVAQFSSLLLRFYSLAVLISGHRPEGRGSIPEHGINLQPIFYVLIRLHRFFSLFWFLYHFKLGQIFLPKISLILIY